MPAPGALPSPASETAPEPSQQQPPGVRQGFSDETGKLSFIGFEPAQPREVPGSVRGSWRPQDHAMASLILYGPEFGVRNPLRDMQLQRVQTTDGGREHSRYQQTYQGVPVLGGELAVNTTSRGQLLSISGEVSPDLSLSTQPQISAAQARETALGVIATVHDLSAADLEATEPELWIFDERLLRPSTRPAELVWRMDVTPRDGSLPIRELVLINAETGGVSLHFNQVDTAWVSAPPAEALAASDPAPLQATITVNTTADDNTVNGNCTLREAIIAANTDTAVDACPAGSGDDVIDLSAGTYQLSIPGRSENAAATGDLDITDSLTIDGAGATSTIVDGGDLDRVFSISGVTSVTLSGVTIQNGGYERGGGIYSLSGGHLTLVDSTITSNGISLSDNGGGIYSTGTVTLNNSTVSGNLGNRGGGIYVEGPLYVNNSTVAENESVHGGGIYSSAYVAISNSTITANTASYTGGIRTGFFLTTRNSIIAGNNASSDGPDCFFEAGTFTSGGHNLIGNNEDCLFTPATGDQIGTSASPIDPALGLLMDNGGPTQTNALLTGSPAIDAGNPATPGSGGDACLATDQRGVARPDGVACDIGAFEGDVADSTPPTDPTGVSSPSHEPGERSFDNTVEVIWTDDAADTGGAGLAGYSTLWDSIPSGQPDSAIEHAADVLSETSSELPNGEWYFHLSSCDIVGNCTNTLHLGPFVIRNVGIRTYDAENSSSLPGTFLCDETQFPCNVDSHARSAHRYARDTYEFYDSHHGRDSIDDAGMTIISSVHYRLHYANAFWNGSQMVYGDEYGYPLADDVVAHELTHGVTQYASGLFYYYQSGAINESFSDLWGEFVDLTNGYGADSASYRWLVGEDVSGIGAIRDMADPPVYGDPDRMGSPLYYTGSADFDYFGDNGGVHTNSGVNNKAVYLMTDGDTFNGETVTGLGIDKVAAIYYEAQTNLLTSGSDYSDLYHALYQACLHVVGGVEGVTQADCQEVRDATDAVEMNLEPAQGYNPHAELCPGSETPFNLFYDDLESGDGNWTFDALTGTSSWVWASGYAASGTNMLWGDDYYEQSDSYAAMNLDVTLPAGSQPYLHFNHAFGFEDPDYDGGWLEVSTDGGGSWSDARSLFDDGLTYSERIRSSSGKGDNNPNADHRAFVGDSHGYVSSRYDLSSLAGEDVRFRWRISTDPLWYDWGWFVDDVRIYNCGTDDVPPTDPNPGSLTSTSHTEGIPSTDNVIVMEWGDGADDVGGSGLAGYSVLFDDQPTSQPDSTVDVLAGASSPNTASSARMASGTWYFHLSTCDVAGNCTNTLHAGPYVVDGTPPQVANVGSVEDSGDGSLTEDEQTRASITQLLISFDEEVRDGTGPDGAENPANYHLETFVAGHDLVISIDAVNYDPGTGTATLDVNGGTRLPPNVYILTIFGGGTSAITDLIGLLLDGNGDSIPGGDFVREFTVLPPCFSLTTALSDEAAGSLSVNPGPNCDGTLYAEDSVVTLEVTPNPDYVFDQWSGDASGSDNPLDVTMDGHKDITANFLACYTLSTQAVPSSGGTVSADVAPNCLGTKYLAGTAVELTATASDNHEFIAWSGDASGTENPVSVTMDDHYDVLALFNALPIEGQPPLEVMEVGVEGDGPYTVELHLAGMLADSCTRLDRVEQSRAGSDVEVEVITVRPGGVSCAQRATPFDVDVTLDGTFDAGTYDLTCNGEPSTFDVP